jgi:hypothetical protein
MRWLLPAAVLLAALPSAAPAASFADLDPVELAAMIDATLFPNSIGPRRQESLKTFADYGFSIVEQDGRTVELYEEDRSWMFGITLLEASDDGLLICVLDRAIGGPTYHTQNALVFEPGDGDLLVATGDKRDDPACPHMGE